MNPAPPADPNKEGGLKTPTAPPADTADEHTGQSDLGDDDGRGDEEGGMLSEG